MGGAEDDAFGEFGALGVHAYFWSREVDAFRGLGRSIWEDFTQYPRLLFSVETWDIIFWSSFSWQWESHLIEGLLDPRVWARG